MLQIKSSRLIIILSFSLLDDKSIFIYLMKDDDFEMLFVFL